ncbi:hypothetical protein BG58_37730 [Caballeronia jiangsuensis]|nr:hypothetical protein BG58_37730 [Caballeronia jiangsuensis]
MCSTEDGMRNAAVAELYGKAAGRCSICSIKLFEDQVKLGEMAHMIAKRQRGPRGELLFDGDLNSYENLILLCPTDHTRVDNDPDSYPLRLLRQLKADHERKVEQMLSPSPRRQHDSSGLYALARFMPLTQIPSLLEFLPGTFYHRLIEVAEAFRTFPIDYPHCRPFADAELERRYAGFEAAFQKLMSVTDGYYHGSYGASSVYYAPFDRDVPWAERGEARASIESAVRELIPVHHQFLKYVQNNYPDVNVAAYQER